MKRFKLILLALLVLPALALLLFGPSSAANLPKDRVIVEYWETWTGAEGDAIKDVVDDFNRTVGVEKGIYVNLLSTAAITQKQLVATAAGVPPDIAGAENTQVAQFAALDMLEPLDDLAAAKGITAAMYKPVFWDKCCTYHGHLYVLPSTPYNYAMFYDQRLFDQNADKLRAAGMDPSRAPRTIAELDTYAKCIDKIDDTGHILVAGYMPMEPGWILEYTCYWFGGSWWDDANERFDLLNPAVVASYKWIQSYQKRLGKDAVQSFRSGVGNFDSPQNAFMAGQVAIEQQGTFMANFINTRGSPQLRESWVGSKFPGITEALSNASYCDCNVLGIPRGAKHKKEAFEFIAYLQQQGPMEKLCGLHCKISALKSVSDNFIRDSKNRCIKVFDDLAGNSYARCAPQCPILPEATEEFTAFSQLLAANPNASVEQELAAMQTRLQAKLDRFNAIQESRRAGKIAVTGLH